MGFSPEVTVSEVDMVQNSNSPSFGLWLRNYLLTGNLLWRPLKFGAILLPFALLVNILFHLSKLRAHQLGPWDYFGFPLWLSFCLGLVHAYRTGKSRPTTTFSDVKIP